VYLIKHIALTGSSNKNILFTDKVNFLQNNLFVLRVIFHFTLVLSNAFDYNFIPELLLRSQLIVSSVLSKTGNMYCLHFFHPPTK